ncbi:MAG: hypothetical protein H6912_10290 [Kordiimonadaceae bacterium]|nr:hypothetical protein [Kordiimonadaceae bacterium]
MTERRLINSISPFLALIYPWAVALGPKINPILLIISLSFPVIAFILAYKFIDPSKFPMARRVSFLAIGAPALYSMIGGWLDGNNFLPFEGDGFWVIFWGLLCILCFMEAEKHSGATVEENPNSPFMKLRTAHGISAIIIIIFALVHLSNHLSGLAGGETHWNMMKTLRTAYRNPVIETILISAIAFQVASGTTLAWQATKFRKELIPTVQLASGIFLLCFFGSHLSAVFRTRLLNGNETDWTWLTSSSLLTDDWNARLVGYYWLGVIALGIHVASGLRYILLSRGANEKTGRTVFIGINIGMILISSLIMIGLFMSSDPWLF